MNMQLEPYIISKGFQKMIAKIVDHPTYFKVYQQEMMVIQVIDCIMNPKLTKLEVDLSTQKVAWRLMDRGFKDPKVLTLFVSQDLEYAKELSKDDPRAWIVDETSKSLIIFEDKIGDYYGVRHLIEQYLINMDEIDLSDVEMAEFNTNGRQIHKSIWDYSLVTHILLIANILLFTASTLSGDYLFNKGALSWVMVLQRDEWYRLITSMFLHDSVDHLFNNMLMLFFLGRMMEKDLGHLKFAILYLVSGLSADILSMIFGYVTKTNIYSIGASGAIFGLFGALLYLTIITKGKFHKIPILAMVLIVVYLVFTGFDSKDIDNAAHIGGLYGGVMVMIVLYAAIRKKARKKEGSLEN